jgi:hypothetical protein
MFTLLLLFVAVLAVVAAMSVAGYGPGGSRRRGRTVIIERDAPRDVIVEREVPRQTVVEREYDV